MILPTGQIVLFWRATRCGLPNITQNFSKMPKLTGKNWRFGDEKPNLVAPSNCMSLVLSLRTRLMQLDGATRFGFSSPNLQFLPVNFGIFEKFWVIFGKPHLVARQIVTFWRVGKIMSAWWPWWRTRCTVGDYGGKHHQFSSNVVAEYYIPYHKFSCRMMALTTRLWQNLLAVSEIILQENLW